MRTWILLAVFALGALSGYKVEDLRNTAKLAEIQAQHQVKQQELIAKKDETISLILKNSSDTTAELTSLGKRIDRVQYNLRITDRSIITNAGRADAKSVQACRQLLAESAGLHRESLEILRDLNTRLEAFIKLNSKEN
jgi:hypothetical protein